MGSHCILNKRISGCVGGPSSHRGDKRLGVGDVVSPILTVTSGDGESIFGCSGSNKRQCTITIYNISILWDENGTIDISEEIDISQKCQILSDDIEIIK